MSDFTNNVDRIGAINYLQCLLVAINYICHKNEYELHEIAMIVFVNDDN